MPRVTGIAPFFLVGDDFFEDPLVFAMVERDDQIIMLSLMRDGRRGGSNRNYHNDALDAYLWTDDADVLHAEFQHSGADIVSAPQLRIYGMKELEVRDLDGYALCFGQDVSGTDSTAS